MTKETVLVNPLRRRTSSQVGLRELAISQQHDTTSVSVFNNVRTSETTTEASTIPENATKTRFRRASFALSGERPDTLDELIITAASHATAAAANREVAVQEKTTKEIFNSSSGGSVLAEGQLCNVPATALLTTSPINRNAACTDILLTDSSDHSSDQQTEDRADTSIKPVVEAVAHDFVWHNDSAFNSNPLKSNLLKEYLARVAVDCSCRSSPDPYRKPAITILPPPPSPVNNDNFVLATLPSAILSASSHSLPVVSIAMPAHHFIGTAAITMPSYRDPTAPLANMAKSCDDHPNHPLDTHWLGYQSDNGILETAASKVQQLQSAASHRSQLEDTYQRRSNFTSPARHFQSIGHRTCGHRTADTLDINRLTHRKGRFNVSHLCEGLSTNRNTVLLPASSSTSRLYPPPPDVSRDSSAPSDEECTGSNTPSSSRLRTLFKQIKPTASSAVEAAALAVLDAGGDFTHSGGGDDYIYMNEEAQERRTKAQVVNVITPVSF